MGKRRPNDAIDTDRDGKHRRADARPPRLRILVVEDHADNRAMVKLLLELHGHDCEATASAESALLVASEWAPHVALVDVGLEGVDGYQLARSIRASSRTSIRLIATTGRPEHSLAAEVAFDAVLQKPFELDALIDLLDVPRA